MFLTERLYEVDILIIYVIIWTSCKEALRVVLEKGIFIMHCNKLGENNLIWQMRLFDSQY